MMNNNSKHILRLGVLIALLQSIIMMSCDTFEDDIQMEAEEMMALNVDRQMLKGNSILFDLTESVNPDTDVSFQVSQNPKRGDLKFINEHILRYQDQGNSTADKDFFVISILEDSSVLDIDTIAIEYVTDTTDIPCMAGAMSDFVSTKVDEEVFFDVLDNDGYCSDSVASALVTVYAEPENGEVVRVSNRGAGAFLYTPDSGFEGSDEFIYKLQLTNLGGDTLESYAQVYIDVRDSSFVCQGTAFPDSISVEFDVDSISQGYAISIIDPSYLENCDSVDFTVEIVEVSDGEAEVWENNRGIEFLLLPMQDYPDFVSIFYKVHIDGGESLDRTAFLSFYGGSPDTCSIQAISDSLALNASNAIAIDSLQTDSVETRRYSWILDVVSNDDICGDSLQDLSIRVVSYPDEGELFKVDDARGQFEYVLDVEDVADWAYWEEKQFTYEICSDNDCDEATVDLMIRL